MIGDPSLGESVKLLWLRVGIAFRGVVSLNPVQQILFDLAVGQVWILLFDASHRLIEVKPLRVRPYELALFSVKLHVVQRFPKGIVDLDGLLAFGRPHPFHKVVDKGIVRKNTLHCMLFFCLRMAGPRLDLREHFVLTCRAASAGSAWAMGSNLPNRERTLLELGPIQFVAAWSD